MTGSTEKMADALGWAIHIIENHVPKDALGERQDGASQIVSILETEAIPSMREALAAYRAAPAPAAEGMANPADRFRSLEIAEQWLRGAVEDVRGDLMFTDSTRRERVAMGLDEALREIAAYRAQKPPLLMLVSVVPERAAPAPSAAGMAEALAHPVIDEALLALQRCQDIEGAIKHLEWWRENQRAPAMTAYRLGAAVDQDRVSRAVLRERERCAQIASNGCLVPPDGGSPTSEEADLCDGIAKAIMDGSPAAPPAAPGVVEEMAPQLAAAIVGLLDAIADAISTIENECGRDSEAQPHTHDGVMAALSDRLFIAHRSAFVSLEGQKKEAGVVGVRDYDAAIQEAAKVCDEIEQRYRAQADGDDQNSDSALFAGGMQAGAKYCATMVRALKSEAPS